MSDVVNDTFTDADDTDIENHTGEVGATWTRDSVFGQGVASGRTFGIFSNKLRRLTFDENSGADGGTSLVRPSGLLPGGTTSFTIEFVVSFDEDNGANAVVSIYQQAINPANGMFLCSIGQGQLWCFGELASFTTALGTEYTVRLEVNGPDLELFVDDVSMLTDTLAATPAEPFGIAVFDGFSTGDANISSFRVFTSAPPGAFWRDYIITTETIS